MARRWTSSKTCAARASRSRIRTPPAEAAAAERALADRSALDPQDRLFDGLHRPPRLRHRDPAAAALRREVPPVAARVRTPHVELFGDCLLYTSPSPRD